MSEHLADTNVGNIEYISKKDAVELCNNPLSKQSMLLVQPADVVPVVHGRWENGRCNKCGGHAPYWSMASTYYESDFCPNCGAKMDAQREE